MTHKGTKIIQTPRLILRPITLDDAMAVYENWASDDRVTKYLRWPSHADIGVTQRVIKEWVSKYDAPDFYQWAIELKDLGAPIGTIGVVDQNEKLDMVHIGYCIGSKWWHKGYTSEAFSAIIPYLFDEVGANRIESQHDPANPHSGAVMKKCGLTYEGTLRQADWSNRGIVDACLYSLLRAQWKAH